MFNVKSMLKIRFWIWYLFVAAAITLPAGLWMLTKGPTRLLANYASQKQWPSNVESNLQKALILVFIILCGVTAYYSTKRLLKIHNARTKQLWIVALGLALSYSVYVFTLQPELLIAEPGKEDSVKTNTTSFYFGSYPDEPKLQQLKNENYTAVISLLHEMVVPAEPILLQKEKTIAKKVGIKVISIPMLPWIVENDAAISQIKQIAKQGKGKYYVHCYLGRDRASIFKNIIQTENKNALVNGITHAKSLKNCAQLERGKVITIQPNVYVTPQPTNEEYFSLFCNGQIQTIVNLLPQQNAEEKTLVVREEKLCAQYNIQFVQVPNATSERKMRLLVNKILQLPKPIAIHSFHSDAPEVLLFCKLANLKNKTPKK